jgi:1-acyl-sn-glycerol-3-phosphate acyltransferase
LKLLSLKAGNGVAADSLKVSPRDSYFVLMAPWYYICLNAARAVFWFVGGVKGVDEQNVPRKGPLIVAPYHVSNLDPAAVACGTNRQLRFMAKEELFKVPLLGPLIRSLGAFPVKRGEGDTEAIRFAIKAIENGEAVLIFPEGKRGDGQHIQEINRGVAMLAKRTGAPVLPVGIVGSHRALPKGQRRLKRTRIYIIYGEAFTYEEASTGATDRENRALFSQELQKRIISLCGRKGLMLRSESSNEDYKTSDAAAPSI